MNENNCFWKTTCLLQWPGSVFLPNVDSFTETFSQIAVNSVQAQADGLATLVKLQRNLSKY